MAIKRNLITLCVYLEPDLHAALKHLSESTGAPMGYYIKQGLRERLSADLPPASATRRPVRARTRKAQA